MPEGPRSFKWPYCSSAKGMFYFNSEKHSRMKQKYVIEISDFVGALLSRIVYYTTSGKYTS